MKSIIQTDRERCYLCLRRCDTEEHHLIGGTAQRKKSEKYGLKIYICRECHRNIHDKNWKMKELQALAQDVFEQTYEEDFFSVFGRYYK